MDIKVRPMTAEEMRYMEKLTHRIHESAEEEAKKRTRKWGGAKKSETSS